MNLKLESGNRPHPIVLQKNPELTSGNTPLHYAAWKGHVQLVKLLTNEIVEKNPRNPLGFTPLHWAVNANHVEVVQFLLSVSADKNPANDLGYSLLHNAANKGSIYKPCGQQKL